MTVKHRLVMTLASAGVPVDAVTVTGPASAVVTYMEWATQAQRDQGAALLAAFDWSDAAQTAWEGAQDPERAGLRDNIAATVASIDNYLLIADTATAAQVRSAVKTLAQIQRRVLLYLERQVK